MGWFNYYDTRGQKDKLRRQIEKKRAKGERFEALQVDPRRQKLSHTFWGQAWCRNLESYADYEYRLPRGRSYLRQGNVYNLEIAPGQVSALVAGSALYTTKVAIGPLPRAAWRRITKQCSGQVGSMLDLLAGKLGDDTMRVLTDSQHGLFPKPREIKFNCSCPDWADMCKHVAAVLYGVGVLLDRQPELLFLLREVDQSDLVTEAGVATLAEDADGGGELAGSDLSALFGIDLGDGSGAPAVVAEEAPAATPKRKAAARKPTKKKAVKKKPAKPRPASKKPSGKPPAAGRKGKAVPRSPSGKGRRKPGVA